MRSYILTPDEILPRRHMAWLGLCMLGSVAMLVLAVILADLRLSHAATPPALDQAASGNVVLGNGALSNIMLYRACINEARLQSRTVHPYPQESRHVELIEDGHMLWRRTEILDVDVSDMSVDNGCLARRDQQLRQDMLQVANFRDDSRPVRAEPHPLAALPCTPQRDAALQSHYLLLSLCAVEMAPHTQGRMSTRKKTALRRPST